MLALIGMTASVGCSDALKAQSIPRNSAEGLCQALAYEHFPEFSLWFDANPQLRPLDATAFLEGRERRIGTIPMQYDFPGRGNEGRFIASFPHAVRRQHPAMELSCEGSMDGARNSIHQLRFNGQSRHPAKSDDWNF